MAAVVEPVVAAVVEPVVAAVVEPVVPSQPNSSPIVLPDIDSTAVDSDIPAVAFTPTYSHIATDDVKQPIDELDAFKDC